MTEVWTTPISRALGQFPRFFSIFKCPQIGGPLPELNSTQIAAIRDIDAANEYGDTALHFAALHNRQSSARTLLARGADRALKNEMGQTASEVATLLQQKSRQCIGAFPSQKQQKQFHEEKDINRTFHLAV